MKKFFRLVLFSFICFFPTLVEASDITSTSTITIGGNNSNNIVVDSNEKTYLSINKGDVIEIKNDEKIYGIYIIYELKSQIGTISNDFKSEKIGQNGFLHEYIDVNQLIGSSTDIKLKYDELVKIADIYVFSEGAIPSFVELWKEPCKEADLLILPTHSDDEQLFLLGVMPTYVARGADVQVAYFTIHYNNTIRLHEQLHGLYAVGIRNYPIIGIVPDHYSTNIDSAIYNMNKDGITENDATKYTVSLLRRFKPQVVVGHDEKGEYSHGQHILNTYILEKALELSDDNTFDSNTYNLYGGWDVPKTYLHLYQKNQIVMDYDTPLDYFGGQTAFEISRYAFTKHVSQQGPTYVPWLNNVNKASEIQTYSPTQYGLYRSTVGEDIQKNDMFENLTFRKKQVKEEVDTEDKEQKKQEDSEKTEEAIKYEKYLIPCLIIIILIISIIILIHKKH